MCPMISLLNGFGSISTFPQLNMCDCGTLSKMAGEVGQMSASCQQDPIAGSSLDFHPNFFQYFHGLYLLTFIIHSLAVFAHGKHLDIVRVHKCV